MISGTPCRLNTPSSLGTVLASVVVVIMETSGHLKWESTGTKDMALRRNLAKSRSTFCQGLNIAMTRDADGPQEENTVVVGRLCRFGGFRDGHQT